jgi:hypothetical protein
MLLDDEVLVEMLTRNPADGQWQLSRKENFLHILNPGIVFS